MSFAAVSDGRRRGTVLLSLVERAPEDFNLQGEAGTPRNWRKASFFGKRSTLATRKARDPYLGSCFDSAQERGLAIFTISVAD